MANPPPPFSLSPPHSLPSRDPQSHVPYPFPQPSSSASRQKPSADDIKYIQKYKDLKLKVKDVELDNDRLHLKVLKTKKNIQRLRIERAILYERLSVMSSPDASQRQQGIHHPPPQPAQPQYSPYSPDPQLHVSRNPQIPQDLQQPVFPLDAHSQIHPDKERHSLELPQRSYSGPDANPNQPRSDPHYSHARPPSPTRLHHLSEPYPLPPHAQQGHMPMDIDRPPAQTPRSRRQQQAGHAHPAPSREGDRNIPLPVSLPPPPNTLSLPPPHPAVRHGPTNVTHTSPRLDRDDRAHGPPDSAGYQHYPGPPVGPPTHRGRERDHERAHLGGPGLPPMRTHPDTTHLQSPRLTSSPSHNGYAHPLPHPFSTSPERHWEREREREREHERERDMQYSVRERRDLHHEPNGFRESSGQPPPPPPPPPMSRRYEGPPSHGNGSSSAQGSPSTPYLASRRSSLGQARTDSAPGRAQEREGYERRDREYPGYEYVRRQEREGMDGGEGGAHGQVYGHGQGRRRSVVEVNEERERERERGHEHRALQKQRRASQDGADERRQIRRDREWEREHAGEKEREDIVPRVREGEPME